ncbi:MAG: cytochrome c biogenesis protein CcsA, partial [Acidimicrobiales bacterium]
GGVGGVGRLGPSGPGGGVGRLGPPVQSDRARLTVRIIGIAAAVGVAATVWLGLWVTPPDQTRGNTVPGNLVRLVYIHPGVAWVALYLAFGLAALASLLYLWPRTRSMFWDRLAAAAVEVGVVFNVCTLISGSIWGKPTWGVYWAWDARLTLTAVLLVLFLGYMALRRVPAEPEKRAKRSAFVALFAAVDIPLVHFSVLWWRTLHQGATVLNPDLSPTIHGSMAWTLLLSFIALTLLFVWMLLVRYRIGVLEDWLGNSELEVALRERQGEGVAPGEDPDHRYRAPAEVVPDAVDAGGAGRPADVGGQELPAVPEAAR